MSIAELEAELAQARATHMQMTRFEGPGKSTFQPWVIALAAQRVTELELRLQHARNPRAHEPPAPVKRAPKETPEGRRARIRASRESRIREAQDRVDAYERTHPINEHGVRTGPCVADNNWRNRQARVDRDIAAWRQYENDIKEIRHLTGLMEKEN